MAQRPDSKAVFSNIDQIKHEHTESGGHFFDPETLRFFNSTILRTLHGKRHNVFVTREVFETGTDRVVLYNVRVAEWYTNQDSGRRFLSIDTASGGFTADGEPVHPDRDGAVRAAKEYAATID